MSNAWLRREAWKQTQQIFADRPSFESELLNTVPSVSTMLNLSRFPCTSVDFVNADSIDIACTYRYHGASVALVCDAQWDSNYEAAQYGAPTQEADCYRRSNYYKHLQIDKYYPLGPLDTFLSKDVEFIRVGLDKQYFFIDKSIFIHVITVPSLDEPITESNKTLCENKIKVMLFAAAKLGVNYLVIPSWGRNLYSVARLFHKVIAENNGLFVKIIFALDKKMTYDEFKKGFDA